MSDDDNVTPLQVKFKPPADRDEPMLKLVSYGGCNHRHHWVHAPEGGAFGSRMVHATYQIREGETEIECSLCGTRLDPMFVLKIMANEENHWMRTRQRYQEEMKRLNERSRTKCWHCNKMTDISRR